MQVGQVVDHCLVYDSGLYNSRNTQTERSGQHVGLVKHETEYCYLAIQSDAELPMLGLLAGALEWRFEVWRQVPNALRPPVRLR